jgi:hypothetical protein|uniref:Uncharacterized protein n=1 Tax=Thermosporothrix sp. COM3 TaxID=2490863 RepID=A0A455SYE4_9CHLR|nr:hypothetical protein KTC_58860 [Thermosporothrix sp. COM3]
MQKGGFLYTLEYISSGLDILTFPLNGAIFFGTTQQINTGALHTPYLLQAEALLDLQARKEKDCTSASWHGSQN